MVNQFWGEEHNDFIRRNAAIKKDKDIAKEMTVRFGRKFTINAIRLQRRSLGIKKKNGRGKCELR